jgi:hypothetical protein
MDETHMRAFSPHISRGYAYQQNSQPVNGKNVEWMEQVTDEQYHGK